MENGFNLEDFRKMKRYDQKANKLRPLTPAHVPSETNKRPLEEQPGPSSKWDRVFIPPFTSDHRWLLLLTKLPVQLPPDLTTPQIILPDPPPVQNPDPPVVETLERTLMDDSSMDQIVSSVFENYFQQGIPPAQTKEPEMLETVPSLFDESNILISFLDHFERGLAIEQQETPMDLTMPRLKKKQDYSYTIIFYPNFGVHIPQSFGKTVIVLTSHLDLTWDKGVELRFFQVGRPPSHRVWDAYQPQTKDAYILDFTDCTRVADVYMKWLTWLDDWEMHRDDKVPWCMVGLTPWKLALEKHVQHSHEKALANGIQTHVTLLERI
ncbi:uncharacterized protein TNCV_2516951 [Trichonephila clavipes]|nr:uncharacterized protein TNCV_2516951 [Trichonephila clavipes]